MGEVGDDWYQERLGISREEWRNRIRSRLDEMIAREKAGEPVWGAAFGLTMEEVQDAALKARDEVLAGDPERSEDVKAIINEAENVTRKAAKEE